MVVFNSLQKNPLMISRDVSGATMAFLGEREAGMSN